MRKKHLFSFWSANDISVGAFGLNLKISLQILEKRIAERNLPFGVFGENLTATGLLEKDVNIGDRFRVGTAQFVVTQTRSRALSSHSF